MYYSSKNSRKKVIHSVTCHYIQNVEINNIRSFETLAEAYQSGYRPCRLCSPIAKQYRIECSEIADYCRHEALYTFLHDKYIGICTPDSKWKIMTIDGYDCFVLYHKNTLDFGDKNAEVPGYHLQKIKKASILGYLKYIVSHEDYRKQHPLHIHPTKASKTPPRKGSKRYKKQQKQEKQIAKRRAVRTVLELIENLQNHPQTSTGIAV